MQVALLIQGPFNTPGKRTTTNRRNRQYHAPQEKHAVSITANCEKSHLSEQISNFPLGEQAERSAERGVREEAQGLTCDQAHARIAGADFLEHDASLDPCQRGTETEMRAMSEREMLVRVNSVNIEAFGIHEDLGIAICRSDQQEQVGIGGYRAASDLDRLSRLATPCDHRRVEA